MRETIERLLAGDRMTLARAITLVESSRPDHQERARELLDACMPHTGRSIRLGITGVPGVGKSTFVEALGLHIIREHSENVAVLAVDPSSPLTGGSILGDKTRMPRLSTGTNAFVRPSPSRGHPGGVAAKTREAILLCEAAGFKNVLVETMGVGQSEVAVASMVDFFLLLMLAGAGDELQGMKRGVLELADLIAFNKADGENRVRAETARKQLEGALALFPSPPDVLTCSARTGDGIEQIWRLVLDHRSRAMSSGEFNRKRNRQASEAMYNIVRSTLSDRFFSAPEVRGSLPQLEKDVMEGRISADRAARHLLSLAGVH